MTPAAYRKISLVCLIMLSMATALNFPSWNTNFVSTVFDIFFEIFTFL